MNDVFVITDDSNICDYDEDARLWYIEKNFFEDLNIQDCDTPED